MMKYLVLIVYCLIMIGIGIFSSQKIRNSVDYLIAGRKGSLWQITGSLLATILGSTAIMGSCDLALTQGWAAAWLLLSASIGLLLFYFVAPLVQRQGKFTLPQLIGDLYGKEARTVSSIVIPLAWIGVIAAQIIGGAKVVNSFLGVSYELSVWGIGLLFIFYTVIGGQISVIRTDLVQSILIILGIAIIALFIFFTSPLKADPIPDLKFPFNKGFHPIDLLILLLTYSTTFLVGPDIYTRLFCAENEMIARRSVLLCALILIPFAFIITFIGVYAANRFPEFDFQSGSSLISVMASQLPEWGIGLLVAALLSAVMSSASTTLLTSSVILANSFQKDKDAAISIYKTKVILVIIGVLSIFLSLKITSIVQSLLVALTFFSGAFILPVLAGLYGFRTSRIKSNMAILTGGLVAIIGKVLTIYSISGIGNFLILVAFVLNGLILFPGGKWIVNSKIRSETEK